MQDEYLGIFTVMSFTGLSLGSLLLSVLTRFSKGNRAFAIVLALGSIAFGLYVWVNITEGGILSALIGATALAVAIWPRAKGSAGSGSRSLD